MILVKVVPYFFHERNIVDLGEIFNSLYALELQIPCSFSLTTPEKDW